MWKLLTICCILGILYNCRSKRQEYSDVLEYWKGREIVFPSLEAKYGGKDTVWSEVWSKPYRILHYIDTSGCTSCRMRLFNWSKYIEELDSIGNNIEVVFVLGIQEFAEFEQQQVVNHFDRPVFYDPYLRLDSLNHLPSNPILQTFLLDSLNRVLAMGDPVKNKYIRKLYYEISLGGMKEDDDEDSVK